MVLLGPGESENIEELISGGTFTRRMFISISSIAQAFALKRIKGCFNYGLAHMQGLRGGQRGIVTGLPYQRPQNCKFFLSSSGPHTLKPAVVFLA